MPLRGAKELISVLDECEDIVRKLEGGGISQEEALREIAVRMKEFQIVAEKSGLIALRRTGREIEKYVKNPGLSPDEVTMLAFVFPTLKSGLEKETVEDIRVAVLETFEILGLPVPTDWQTSKFVVEPEKPSAVEDTSVGEPEEIPAEEEPELVEKRVEYEEVPLESLMRATSNLGVEAVTEPDGSVVIRVDPAHVPQIQRLLSPADPDMDFESVLPAEDDLEKKVLAKVKEFMVAFSSGDFEKAEEILEELSSIQEGSEIFGEIGKIARHLHTAFKDFAKILDPALKELAVDYLPDSESRLRYLMKLTEDAANTTLDCTEKMKDRIRRGQEVLEGMRKHLERLKPIGSGATKRIGDMIAMIEELESSLAEEKEDVDRILSAQNFQDLSGQTVIKVLNVMQELQDRLVNAIKTFGIKIEGRKKEKEELIGPAHEGVEGALRSQDEVDALLAQFGF
ncbi:protein phosphatase CheZ [Thermodesulforhabdus norvegica]|uniref:Chemotaxis phosphatase, CheZ n=1 Tax=Thermodesulforhabdus norvegica TaxID=39841 RepID=A0A1I4TGI1_9BACT|nr:protein phosphatase CheZ [Thermodesulforhabdus norvegica]SFM75799.1 Chemotaxis phosphatase, CheZ [Thermodesulforhabdus norvegica]